uniref:Uncharacterized protein n=1 Tax=viral metagenome TaxID=1070528 RepID=A0A6H1ZRA3_9ZZZZ
MADDNLDTETQAQDTDQSQSADQGDSQVQDQVDTQQADQQQQDEPRQPFTPEEQQFIGSWMGRMVKKQIEESILPEIQRLQPQAPQQMQGSPDALAKFNETLQEKIFTGDVMGAFRMMQQVQDTAKIHISKQQKIAVDRAVTSFSDKPFYKDIYPEMQKIANEAVGNNYPPAVAAELAYNKAIAERSIRKASKDPGKLAVLQGGGKGPKVQTPKLPDAFKTAARRDIAKGIFKDEADYIANLSPNIREKYGI